MKIAQGGVRVWDATLGTEPSADVRAPEGRDGSPPDVLRVIPNAMLQDGMELPPENQGESRRCPNRRRMLLPPGGWRLGLH
jgi:hypothetical protein